MLMIVNVSPIDAALSWLAYGTHYPGFREEFEQQRINDDLSREREVEPRDRECIHPAAATGRCGKLDTGYEWSELFGLRGSWRTCVVVRKSSQPREGTGTGGFAGSGERRGEGGRPAQHVAALCDGGGRCEWEEELGPLANHCYFPYRRARVGPKKYGTLRSFVVEEHSSAPTRRV